MGMVYLKLNMDNEAKEICSKILDQHPNNEKALFRRGQVREAVILCRTGIELNFLYRLI